MANYGDIRYREYLDFSGKTQKVKQKYYGFKVDYGAWIGYNDVYTYLVDFSQYNQFISDSIIQFAPDNSLDIDSLNLVSNRNILAKYKLGDIKITQSTYSTHGIYIEEEGQTIDYRFGYIIYEGWAEFIADSVIDEILAPDNLDKDYTKEEVIGTLIELQNWTDNNLLPPIFGKTNCVYFPSNLGDCEPDKPDGLNPVIKSYPIQGIYSYNLNNYNVIQNKFGFIGSQKYELITGKINQEFTINCFFRFIPTTNRFDIRWDVQQVNFIDVNNPKITDRKSYAYPEIYKVGQLINLRFIEQSAAEDNNLPINGKFNKYNMLAIITKSNVPLEKTEDIKDYEKKYSISFKIIKDYELTENEQFKALIIIDFPKPNNFVQNKTFNIQRYYKKDLGIGPRLGGSIQRAYRKKDEYSNSSANTETFLFYTVLKDDERLNIPYKNISFSGNILKQSNQIGNDQSFDNWSSYSLNHTFGNQDSYGLFEYSGNYIIYSYHFMTEYLTKYESYLIKNIDDEHSFLYYENLKKEYDFGSFYNFTNFYENSNITFSLYS